MSRSRRPLSPDSPPPAAAVAAAAAAGKPAPPPTCTALPGRRAVLAFAGTAGAAAAVGLVSAPRGAPSSAAAPVVRPRVVAHGPVTAGPPDSGTTLTSVAAPSGEGPYKRLVTGPGWPRVVRTELAGAGRRRAERRVPLAAFVQFTDMHLVDVQHPLRYEYLRAQTSSAWRPQEALSVAGAISLVERVNALAGGPATGTPLACVVTTGDNTDNNSRAELGWFLRVMSGGRVTPSTGDPRLYEGVQDSGLTEYWQPDSDVRDTDKAVGFPRMDGYLRAATSQVTSPGLALPWYVTLGNHDLLPGGCYAAEPSGGFLAEFATGGRKLMRLPEPTGARLWKAVERGQDPKGLGFEELLRTRRRHMREVTPDEARAPFTAREYVRALADPAVRGRGPVGHGYTDEHAEGDGLHYAFRISAEVTGYSLDTTRRDGHYQGRIGDAQLEWLERRLERDKDTYAVILSHHTSTTTPEGGARLLELLGRTPHALAWVNGHSHRNRITPHGSFWEISCASHIDFPQLARAVELVDNRDGTLSLFTTLIESAAPHGTDFTDLSQTGLASLYRELAFNAPGARDDLAGGPADRNTELLLPKP